jgi:hypothetical protein
MPACEDSLESLVLFLPGRVLELCPRQACQVLLLHPMNQSGRLSLGGNKVVPPAGTQGWGDSEHPIGDGVAAVVVVKEPTVQALFPQYGLN